MSGRADDKQLKEEIAQLKESLADTRRQLNEREVDRQQLQASYDEALQALADSEAKRETAERELKISKEQMNSMWKELEMLHLQLNGSAAQPPSNIPVIQTDGDTVSQSSNATSLVNESALELYCTLCKAKIRSESNSVAVATKSPRQPARASPRTSKYWPFSSRGRVVDLDAHSKVCASQLSPSSPSQAHKTHTSSPTASPKKVPAKHQKQSCSPSPQSKSPDHTLLRVNVTRTLVATDLAPFKVVTKTTMPHFKGEAFEVFRSAGDFQWLHDVLCEACPERVIPPLRTTISLDATVSEYQRFLSRICNHRSLHREHLFVTFLTGTVEELRTLRAKFRPRLPEEGDQYRPAQGRDTSTGALVATQTYLETLETNLTGLLHQLQQPNNDQGQNNLSHWFKMLSESEPCDTYTKVSSGDMARTCETIETQQTAPDGDALLIIQNIQSITDYVHAARDLLSRVEAAVDKFLFWDEEVTIFEAVTSSPGCDTHSMEDIAYDDSGISSVSGSSANSPPPDTETPTHTVRDDSISEKWAVASSNCADAKEYLEMMCRELSDELGIFDLRKEQELKEVFLDMASAELEKNEKLQGKWYAMKCLLDRPLNNSTRAIQFVNRQSTTIDSGDHKKK